jgi:hypothetical protein
MSKRQDRIPLENSRLVEDSIGWTDSPEDALSDQVMDAVWTVLEQASINARKRKIIWADGQKLSINQSVKRIHADHQGSSLELIEFHLLGWLEQVVVSPFHSEEQLAELNRLIGKWIEAHERQAEEAQERTRTRHS